jgi:hypothetical protein
MKSTYKILTLMSGVMLVISNYSCQKTFYTDANVNPSAPTSVSSNTLLSAIEVSLAYTQGGAAGQFTSLLTQQDLGIKNQAAAYYNYIFTPQDPEYLWDQMYTYVMENDYTLMNQAKAAGQNEYFGIANIIMAYSLQTMVDFWGSIPYSTAFQGGNNTTPTYDNGQTLYSDAITLLNTGIAALNNPSKGILTPSTDDFIYSGNETSWTQFAHAVKARLYIHQCKAGNAAYEDSAISEVTLSGALSGTFGNAMVKFALAATNNGPWYQFNNQRLGYIEFITTSLIDSMIASNDPRDSIFVNFYASSGITDIGGFYGNDTSRVEFITAEELDLIAAEAYERLGNTSSAQTAFVAAIKQNMSKLGVPSYDVAPYITTQGTLSSNMAAAMLQIGIQDWTVLYLNPEAWTSWRRLGWPALTSATGSEIPRRMIYPTTEVTLNANHVPAATLYEPLIFWDAE